jgi:hypothetical protein
MSSLSKSKMREMVILELGGDPCADSDQAIVDVELSEAQYDVAFRRTMMWFTSKKGFVVLRPVQIADNITEYKMKDDVGNVLDVYFDVPSDVAAFFSLGFFDLIPYGPQSIGNLGASLANYSGFVQLLNFNKNRKDIFSVTPEWSYQQQTKILNITVRSGSVQNMMLIQCKLNNFEVEKLDDKDQDLFYRYVLAKSKKIVGRIRSKYDSLPGAGGPVTLDGRALIEEADKEIEQLDIEIFASQGPDMPVVG